MAILLRGDDAIGDEEQTTNSNNEPRITFHNGKWTEFKNHCNSIRFHNVPLINIIILTILSFLLCKLSTRYHRLYTRSSIVATVATNLVLFGIADSMAQSITAFFARPNQFNDITNTSNPAQNLPGITQYLRSLSTGDSPEQWFVDFGQFSEYDPPDDHIGEFDESYTEAISRMHDATKFNFRRFVSFVLWGFFQAFIQVAWYLFLNNMYTDDPTFVGVLERDLTDQLCFSPISLACFFTYSTIVTEGGTMDDAKKKLRKVYLPTLACNFCLWFPVQFINFLIMPHRLQVPFSSTVGVLWNCFLSIRNAAAS